MHLYSYWTDDECHLRALLLNFTLIQTVVYIYIFYCSNLVFLFFLFSDAAYIFYKAGK